MKKKIFLYLFLPIASFFLGCSVSQNGSTNYLFSITAGNIFAYNGMPIIPSPAFSVFEFNSSLTLFADFSDSVSLQAFSDSKCSKIDSGILIVNPNPQTLEGGVATFSSVTYTIPTALSNKETSVYLKGTLVSAQTTYCTPAISMIQHFNVGNGYIVSSATASTAGWATPFDKGVQMKIDSSGRYVVAGTSKNAAGDQVVILWRYFPDGTLDSTFNSPHGYVYEVGSATGRAAGTGVDSVVDFLIDSSGRYLILGTSKDNSVTPDVELTLWRFNPNGTIDTTFGLASSGVYSLGSIAGRNSPFIDQPKAMQLDVQSNIFVTGQAQDSNNGKEFFVTKINSDGSGLDSSFNPQGGIPGVYRSGATGAAGATFGFENDSGNSIQLDLFGNLVIAGVSLDSTLIGQRLAVWKIQPSGIPDSSFGINGVVISGSVGAANGFGAHLAEVANSLKIDSNGNYVISGSSENNLGGNELALWRYLDTGAFDSSFNGGSPLHITYSAADGVTLGD